MACLPLIERELRVALRKQGPAQGRLKIAAIATGGSMLFLWFGTDTNDPGAGRSLEQLLCLAALTFVFKAPRLAAGVLAEERRNQTLGLLFLSGLGAAEVFAAKFLSSALITFTNLLAIFPMLALPFLTGGVPYDLFLAIICSLPALMLFALAVSLLASVLTREDGTALVLANVLGVLLCGLTPAIYLAQTHFSPGSKPSLWWLRLSPAYGPFLAGRGLESGFSLVAQSEFWRNLVLTLGWSALALASAAFALKRVWREFEENAGVGGWRKRWRQFMHGDRESRQCLARLWLDRNPFVWLASRNRQPATLGWLVVGGFVLAWLLGWAVWGSEWTGVPNFFLSAALLNMVLAWLARHTAATEIGLARRDGAYELLLTTPLEPSDIVWGEMEALRRHFGPLSNFVLLLDVLMMVGGLALRSWNQGALVVYVCIWLFLLAWTWRLGHRWSRVLPVMWVSLNCGRAAFAVWRSSGSKSWVLFWPLALNLYNMRFVGGRLRRFPSGSPIEVTFILIFGGTWLLIWLLKILFIDKSPRAHEFTWNSEAMAFIKKRPGFERGFGDCEERLISEFREIVREPLPDPRDPRFKKWNVQERFPWGWGLVQHQLLERLGRKPVHADELWKSRESS
jgi:ABC-type transport system involved in multi-copper enzyme maturation permease subunit